MNNTQGTFIVIEGTDGSGKGTQFKLLAERLQKAGYDVALFDFPQYENPSSYFVRQYLNGEYGDADHVGPYTGSLFYALDRFEAAKEIRKAIDDGKVVLANRFVGSNMAHQGTKFTNAEERRGYFIWLDNLEFEMLRIPRPTASFVLRVPADIAQNLVDQKETRSYTDKKRDIHEADLSHLERSVQVYDEMCQLFPRDFISIDCVRSGRLMDVEDVQRVLWEKIDSILPEPPQLEMSMPAIVPERANEVQEAEVVATAPNPGEDEDKTGEEAKAAASKATSDQSTQTPASQPRSQIIIDSASQLLCQALASDASLNVAIVPETDTVKRYITPRIFSDETRSYYTAALDKIYEAHDYIIEVLASYIATQTKPVGNSGRINAADARAQATKIARAVLPLATVSKVAISGFSNQKDAPVNITQSTFGEFQTVANQLWPNHQKTTSHTEIAALAQKYLPENYASDTPAVQLISYTPRNEIDIVADILYEWSSLPLTEVKAACSGLSYAQKITAINAYLSNDSDKQALQKITYTWDLLESFETFSALQANGFMQKTTGLQRQEPTPRYGYEVPAIIEKAGLDDYFEACFDISLRLHSYLQSAGHMQEAQYATLLGHRIRWTMTHDALQLQTMQQTSEESGVTLLYSRMRERLLEIHPLIT